MTDGVLDGTVALVTGASSGIGEATALSLAQSGASVVLAARRADRLEQLAARIADAGGAARVAEADLTDPEQAAGVVERAVAELGRLDTVVNNAGVMFLGPAIDAPLEEWDRMIALNLQALLHVTHAALPHLLAAVETSPRGVTDLVNISSVAGRRPRAGSAVYNLTKFGVGALSEALRQEVTGQGVRVSVVEPGAVSTELASHLRPEIRAISAKRFEGLRRLEASDIADTIEFIVTRPAHMAINEVLVRPTDQAD
jgi:NADP-dependent 3-hydroxy acid dehydrogenase YdfG